MTTEFHRLSRDEVADAVDHGARFVRFPYVISVCLFSMRFRTEVCFLRADEHAWRQRIGYAAVSFFAGWWGFPFGLLYTPAAIFACLRGGEDVTGEMLDALGVVYRGRIDASQLGAIFGRKSAGNEEGITH